MKYTNSVKCILKNITKMHCLLVKIKNNNYVYILETYSGIWVSIDVETFKIIAPICKEYVPGFSFANYLYKTLYIADEYKYIINKIREIEKQTGDEIYTTVMTPRDEALREKLQNIQKEINKLLED